MLWQTSRRKIQWSGVPLIMGVLNVTPDSFSDGGKFDDMDRALERSLEIEAQGAHILDIGGESTHPHADPVAEAVEIKRVVPLIKKLADQIKIPISVDTYKSTVAQAALDAGAEIVNDVGGGKWDEKMWDVVATYQCGYVLMHSQGTPQTMQDNPSYEDVCSEVYVFLEKNLQGLLAKGISKKNIVVDPGIGFGKLKEENVTLINACSQMLKLGCPVLMGVSRKSFLKNSEPMDGDIEMKTRVAEIAAAFHGASLWRTHNVSDAFFVSKILDLFLNKK